MEPLSRLTPATADVLHVLLDATDPVWGLRLVQETGRPAGSVYPILSRLESAGWVTSAWEDDPGRSGPRRRLYELTADGVPAARAAVARIRETRSAASGRIAGASS
jgi:DNA-binding IclR family transcriptional regulator